MSLVQYPVPEIVERIRMLSQPADLAEVVRALMARVALLHNGSDDAQLVQLTHGALHDLESADAWLKRAADEMPDADYERAARAGRLRQDIFAAMRNVA